MKLVTVLACLHLLIAGVVIINSLSHPAINYGESLLAFFNYFLDPTLILPDTGWNLHDHSSFNPNGSSGHLMHIDSNLIGGSGVHR